MLKEELLLEVIRDLRSLADRLQAVVDDGAVGERLPTLEEVRAVLVEKSHAGYTAEVKELLDRYGADKLSEINSAKYPALLADADLLGRGVGQRRGDGKAP